MAIAWLRVQRAMFVGWWRQRSRPKARPAPAEPELTDLAPAFTALSFFFRPAALIAGALYVHERVEARKARERALRRARIAWAALGASVLVLALLSLIR